eukprot:4600007-Prymnesium_polylepis.1
MSGTASAESEVAPAAMSSHTAFGAKAASQREYAAMKTTSPDAARGPVHTPPIDAERRSRSPGLHNNFYDVPTADFKRPHGMPTGAPPPPEAAPLAASAVASNFGA